MSAESTTCPEKENINFLRPRRMRAPWLQKIGMEPGLPARLWRALVPGIGKPEQPPTRRRVFSGIGIGMEPALPA